MKTEYDSNGNLIYFENSNGHWEKQKYDTNGNKIYFETSTGHWGKQNTIPMVKKSIIGIQMELFIDNRPKKSM